MVEGTLTCVPAAGRVAITDPRGALLGDSVASPRSKPSFSRSACASIFVMPVTVGTVPIRWPPLTTRLTGVPIPSREPGGGDCSSTVIFGAESWTAKARGKGAVGRMTLWQHAKQSAVERRRRHDAFRRWLELPVRMVGEKTRHLFVVFLQLERARAVHQQAAGPHRCCAGTQD